MLYSEFISATIQRKRFSEAERDGIVAYAKGLESSGLPVLFSLKHIAFEADVDASFLASVVDRQQRHYRLFNLPKRRGGSRAISVPTPYLAHAQRWILDNILDTIPISPAATGFRNGSSISKNADAHRVHEQLLKMDVRDFFGSITRADVERLFLSLGYTPKVSYSLSRICTLFGRLPQGAPTSPALSNIFMREFDKVCVEHFSAKSMAYTRYADDISISGVAVSSHEIGFVVENLRPHGLRLAPEKTVIADRTKKKIVTGVSISSGQNRLPRPNRRTLRQIVHYICKFGLDEHLRHIQNRDPIYKFRLLGKLNHWKSIEPDNYFAKRGITALKKR